MVVRTASVLLRTGVCLIVFSQGLVYAQTDETDFDAVCVRARQDLKEGRWDEAMAAMTAVEGKVRAEVEREPGRELSVLMIKARAYWHRMDTQGLEQFLTQFEKNYARTSATDWVQRAAAYERMLGYRFAEDLPQAVQAFEKYRELEEQFASDQPHSRRPDALARDFDLHVVIPAQIGDLYRYMGRMDAAAEKYRLALEYATAHAEAFRPLDEKPGQLLGSVLSPSAYRDQILPAAIRECEAPQGSTLAALGRDVTCEAQQADWFLSVAQECRQPRALDAARKHYLKAQQALEANQNAIDSLRATDKARYLAMREHIAKNVEAFNVELVRLSDNRR